MLADLQVEQNQLVGLVFLLSKMTPDDVNDQIEENISDKVFFMSEIEGLDELMMHRVHYAVHAEDLKDERFMEEAREELCKKLLEEYQSSY